MAVSSTFHTPGPDEIARFTVGADETVLIPVPAALVPSACTAVPLGSNEVDEWALRLVHGV